METADPTVTPREDADTIPTEGEGPIVTFDVVNVKIGTKEAPIITQVRKFPEGVPLAQVNIRLGKKKQLTQFEPIEVSVSLTRNCVDSNKGVDDARKRTTKQVLHILTDVMAQLIRWDRSGGKEEITL